MHLAAAAAVVLAGAGISALVLNISTMNPLDEAALDQAAATGAIVTVEEALVRCGLGGAVAEYTAGHHPVPVERLGFQGFQPTGSLEYLFEINGLTVEGFVFQSGHDTLVNAGGQAIFSLRGYQIGGGISLRDGLPGPTNTQDIPVDENTPYERIEVLKGPAGTLYGSHSMGGVVNTVSKWPKFKAETKAEFTAQSYEQFFRAAVDTFPWSWAVTSTGVLPSTSPTGCSL